MGTHSSTENQSILSGDQKNFLRALVAQIMPEIGQAGEVYAGQIAPDASPLQQEAFASLSNIFGGQSGQALNQLLSGQPAYEVDPAARQQLYQAEMASQMGQLDDTWARLEERANFDGGSGRSGGLNRSMTQAAADTHLGLGRFYGGLGYQDEQARRMAAQQGVQNQAIGLQAQNQMLGAQLGAGQMQRGIEGQQYAEAYNKWLAGRPENNPWLGFTPQVLGTQTTTPVSETWGWG